MQPTYLNLKCGTCSSLWPEGETWTWDRITGLRCSQCDKSRTVPPWQCDNPEHWLNPETGQIECEACCGHAMDIVYKREAHARLMSAAPLLLDALKEMREHAEYSNAYGEKAFRQAEAAIAKATGGAE